MKLLNAGPLVVGYENGFLRRFSYGGSEVLRMIYFALRDKDWNTFNSYIEDEVISVRGNGFEITYDCFHIEGGVTFMKWETVIRGNHDGSITFEINGVAKETFKKNRAGFCVLHPLDYAGHDCNITHADSTETTPQFPEMVAADNPFKNIRSMVWTCNGEPFTLVFEGDIFETEDQRNWGDASFKTFCTPLDKPFPAELKRGEKVFQRVTFKPLSVLKADAAKSPFITLSASALRTRVPYLGVGASTESHAVGERARLHLQALRLRHYRVEVYPATENWVSAFSADCETAHDLDLALEVALHLSENYADELASFVVLCQQNRVRLRKVLLLSANAMVTRQEVVDEVPGLREALPGVLFGAGTNYNFNEINKNRFNAGPLEFLSFSMDPQEHAFDDLTILENTGTFESLVKSARSIYGEAMAVHLSPVTLRRRFNPYAANPDDLIISASLKTDQRQKDNFTAAWTFGSICNLAKGGASFVTLFQTVGNQGILSPSGDTYPVYDVVKAFARFQNKPAQVLESSDPLTVNAILLDGKVLGLVNFTAANQSVRWNGLTVDLGPYETRFQDIT